MNCACNKRPYLTRAAARVGFHRLLGRGGERRSIEHGRTQTYQCSEGLWHVGRAHLQAVVNIRRGKAA